MADAAAHVALDPEGQHALPLLLLVLAPTGVTYGHRCGGNGSTERCAEGYLVPLGGAGHGEALSAFFWRNFRGAAPQPDAWEGALLERLSALVGKVSCWGTAPACAEGPKELGLDHERLDELTDGWVPVQTAMGPGVLIFQSNA